MKKLIPVFTILASSCGTAEPEPRMNIHADLKAHTEEFIKDCNKYLGKEKCNPKIQLVMKVRPLADKKLGVCYIYNEPFQYKRKIVIDDEVMGAYNQKLVVYHELLHCLFQLDHFDDEIDILNTYVVPSNVRYINQYWDYFVEKAFRRVK